MFCSFYARTSAASRQCCGKGVEARINEVLSIGKIRPRLSMRCYRLIQTSDLQNEAVIALETLVEGPGALTPCKSWGF